MRCPTYYRPSRGGGFHVVIVRMTISTPLLCPRSFQLIPSAPLSSLLTLLWQVGGLAREGELSSEREDDMEGTGTFAWDRHCADSLSLMTRCDVMSAGRCQHNSDGMSHGMSLSRGC